MNDNFIRELKQAPPPGFAADLRERLRQQERGERGAAFRLPTRRFAVLGAAAALLMIALAVPAVRASAAAFLGLFRVSDFAAVPVDVSRLEALDAKGFDLPQMIGDQVEVMADPGPPLVVGSPEQAAAAAGLALALPEAVPPGMTVVRAEVTGARSARVWGDSRKLQSVLDALGITDVQAPTELDGKAAVVRLPPIVQLVYASGDREISFLQSMSPEVDLPEGVDLPGLGEIAFRIAGLDPNEAHTLAQAIDWRGTLIVPVPAGVSTFRQVEINGSRGLFLDASDGKLAVMWSRNGRVYAMLGRGSDETLLQMAESVR